MKPELLEECFFGAATVGERGQIVIPADARKKLSIHAGDKLFVVLHPAGNSLLLFRAEELREMLSSLLKGLGKFEQQVMAEAEPKTTAKK